MKNKYLFLYVVLLFMIFQVKFIYCSNWFRLNIPNRINILNDTNTLNWITIKEGHFVIAKTGERIRFFGTTVGWSYPNASHKAIDRSVKYMKSVGINCVRIHYPGLWERCKNEFNRNKIEKFDYLTYSLSKHKIYYVLYSLNMLYLNYKGGNGYSFKATRPATLMDSTYIKGIKIFWDSLMNHKNIYTGIKYKNDSTLAFIILTNENSVDKLLRIKGGKKLLRIYWDLYKGKYGFSNIKFPEAENSKTYKYLLQFAAKEDSSYFVNMKKFLRGIGVKVPMTFTNNPYSYYTQKTLSKIVDFICVHTYGNYAGEQYSKMLRISSPLIFHTNIPPSFPTRMLTVNYQNKPIIVDEWNIGYPSIYRLEPIILVPALSGLDDYDGVFYFLMFQHKNYVEAPHKRQKYFLTSLEAPYSLQVLFFPIISYAFRNGYIPVYSDSIILNVNDGNDEIDSRFQYRYNPLSEGKGLLYFIKRVIIKFSDSSNLRDIRVDAPKNNIITNRNLYWDYKKGIFSVVTKKFIAYAGKSNFRFSFKGFELNSKNDRICLTIVPLDNKPIKLSHKMIIVIGENSIHEGDEKFLKYKILNKYMTYYPGKKEQTSIYRIPSSLLLEIVYADISIPHVKDKNLNLYALYPNGKTKYISTVFTTKRKLNFSVNSKKYKTPYFLIMK